VKDALGRIKLISPNDDFFTLVELSQCVHFRLDAGQFSEIITKG
jgi:hypothetical protein